jgi:hypothetical protein
MSNQRKISYTLFVSAIILAVLACLSGRSLVNLVRGYLQPTIRVPGATILVVEAWLAPHILKAAKLEFDRIGYEVLITAASGPVDGTESNSSINKSTACRAAVFLKNLGVDGAGVVCLTDTSRSQHDTFAEAKAVKDWLTSTKHSGSAVNVFTGNTHGRKSWVAFRRTLKGVATVGIVSHPGWQSNRGLGPQSRIGRIRVLLKHGFGYLYALIWPVGW